MWVLNERDESILKFYWCRQCSSVMSVFWIIWPAARSKQRCRGRQSLSGWYGHLQRL